MYLVDTQFKLNALWRKEPQYQENTSMLSGKTYNTVHLLLIRHFFFLEKQKLLNDEAWPSGLQHGMKSVLTTHNWQNWKSTFPSYPCHKIYKEEAVGLKKINYIEKIAIFVNMWN